MCYTDLSCRVGRRVEQPGQEPVCRPVFPSVALRDLQRHELGEAGLEDASEGVLVEADRQPLHVALHLAERVDISQEFQDILNMTQTLKKAKIFVSKILVNRSEKSTKCFF